jgi:glycogen synthase
MKNAMAQNFDWHASAGQYIQLYGEMLAKRQ